ncbi:MAG: hypothetical protein AAF677_00245 [Pseudomonadota bacterium]
MAGALLLPLVLPLLLAAVAAAGGGGTTILMPICGGGTVRYVEIVLAAPEDTAESDPAEEPAAATADCALCAGCLVPPSGGALASARAPIRVRARSTAPRPSGGVGRHVRPPSTGPPSPT